MTRPDAFDARILDKLAQVVAIVRHNGWGTQGDVLRVAVEHLGHRTPNPRAEAAERENRALRAQLEAVRQREARRPKPAVITTDGRRIAHLARRELEVLTAASEGTPRPQIAERLGVTLHNVNNTLWRAARKIGATDAEQAIALVAAGRVQIATKAA